MTLAALLLVSILGAAAPQPMADGSVAHSSLQSSTQSSATPATQSDNAPAQQNQGQTPPPANPSATNPSTPPKPSTASPTPAQTQTVHKRPHHKKKPVNTNCVPDTSTPSTSDPASASSSNPQSLSDAQTSGAPAQTTAAASTNCPPPKVIVRQGGTKEPSIELVGGAGGSQAAELRDTDNRILKTAEDNLAKLAGRTLDSNQQDTVNQIRQFVNESKAAIAAGELERARTLASKAQQLSQDLVQPPK
jgi:hypothetical protein